MERESSRARARERERERERESLLAPISLLLAVPPTQRLTTIEAKGRGEFSRVFVAGRMVFRLFLESYGTLVTVSAPLVMPMCDSDIPMNVPFTFRNKQPFPLISFPRVH